MQAPDLSMKPADMSSPAAGMSMQPTDMSMPPADMSMQPADMAMTPADLSVQPADMTMQPADMTMQPLDIPSHYNNGNQDGDESAVDCGGSSNSCGEAKRCNTQSDCQANLTCKHGGGQGLHCRM